MSEDQSPHVPGTLAISLAIVCGIVSLCAVILEFGNATAEPFSAEGWYAAALFLVVGVALLVVGLMRRRGRAAR